MKGRTRQKHAKLADVFYCNTPVPYGLACRAQEQLVALRLARKIPDTILFVEHLPVVTLGRSGRTDSLLKSPRQLANAGIDLVQSTRGGDVTYHAPGKLVVYPVMRLEGKDADVRRYVNRLEEASIRTAADFGVKTFRLPAARGVWTGTGKLAAIGVRVSRWVTSHGMSFNVDLDLSGYGSIVPCGRKGDSVVSLKTILGPACPSIADVRARMCVHFAELFELKPVIRVLDRIARQDGDIVHLELGVTSL